MFYFFGTLLVIAIVIYGIIAKIDGDMKELAARNFQKRTKEQPIFVNMSATQIDDLVKGFLL